MVVNGGIKIDLNMCEKLNIEIMVFNLLYIGLDVGFIDKVILDLDLYKNLICYLVVRDDGLVVIVM